MKTRDPLEALLDRQVTPSPLAHQLMAFFAERIDVGRPELTRLALGLSLADDTPPQLIDNPAAIYEAYKPAERSIAIRLRILFGDGTWRMWASLIRLHAKRALIDRDLLDTFARHWERGLAMLRVHWNSVHSTDALLGRLLRRLRTDQPANPASNRDLIVVTSMRDWDDTPLSPLRDAGIGMIVVTTRQPKPKLGPARWLAFEWPMPSPIPLYPFARLPDEKARDAARRINACFDTQPDNHRPVATMLERLLSDHPLTEPETLVASLSDPTNSPPWLEFLARSHLFWTYRDGHGAFDLSLHPWFIDISSLSPTHQATAARALALGINQLAHDWQAIRDPGKLRLAVFADRGATAYLPRRDDRRLGIAWRPLQTG